MIFGTLRELDTNIKAGAPLPVYLLYGEESRQIEAARERIVRTVTGGNDSVNFLRVDGSIPIDLDAIGDMLWSVSFIGGRKCVAIEDWNLSLADAGQIAVLEELLTPPAPETVLVITVQGSASQFGNKKDGIASKLLKLCDTAGAVCHFGVMTRGDVAKYARQLALKQGCLMQAEESLLLADYCGLDSLRLTHEVEKLTAYHGGTGTIERCDIEAMVAPVVDANVFQLGDRVLRHDFNGAMAVVDDLLFLQERPESILTILTMSFVDYYRAAAARRSNTPEATARKELGYGGSYRFTKALEQCGRMSNTALEDALEILADADFHMKQAGADGRTVLEATILQILQRLQEDRP